MKITVNITGIPLTDTAERIHEIMTENALMLNPVIEALEIGGIASLGRLRIAQIDRQIHQDDTMDVQLVAVNA